jgi:hypothetical protein
MLNPLFDPASYHAVRKPLLEASTLPPACYTCSEFAVHALSNWVLDQVLGS